MCVFLPQHRHPLVMVKELHCLMVTLGDYQIMSPPVDNPPL